MADNTMCSQKFQQRHFEQSRVEEQLSGCGPSAGITLEAFLDKLLQKQTQVKHFWKHEGQAIWLVNRLLNTVLLHSLLISPSEMGSPVTVWNSWEPPEKCKMTPHSHGFPKAPSEKPSSMVRNCSWVNTCGILAFLTQVLPPEHRCQMSRYPLLWWHQHLEQETQWRHIAAWSELDAWKTCLHLQTVKLQTIKSHNKDTYLPLCTSIFWSIEM